MWIHVGTFCFTKSLILHTDSAKFVGAWACHLGEFLEISFGWLSEGGEKGFFSSVGDTTSTQTVFLSDLYSFFVYAFRTWTSAHLLCMKKFQKTEEILLYVQAIELRIWRWFIRCQFPAGKVASFRSFGFGIHETLWSNQDLWCMLLVAIGECSIYGND